jgi:hypothetical protein
MNGKTFEKSSDTGCWKCRRVSKEREVGNPVFDSNFRKK